MVPRDRKELPMPNMIQIGNWSYPRQLGVDDVDGRLKLQVKLSCGDCPACLRRKEWVEGRLSQLGLEETAVWENEGCVLSLPEPPVENEEAKLAFLTNLLGLPVRLVG
jgi:hypothetical protein